MCNPSIDVTIVQVNVENLGQVMFDWYSVGHQKLCLFVDFLGYIRAGMYVCIFIYKIHGLLSV